MTRDHLNLPESQIALQDAVTGFIHCLAASIDARDSYTWGHSERVARIAVALGRHLGLPRAALSDLYVAGLLHDIGKLATPDEILQKNGPLTEAEFAKVKEHPVVGEALLTRVDALNHIRPVVRHHHERYDGCGYPDRLEGERIPLLARIMAVADSFDAMNSDRPYRKALDRERIDQCMLDGSGKAWDPRVVRVFLRCREEIYAIGRKGLGESVDFAVHAMLQKESNDSSAFIIRDVFQSVV